MVYSNCRWSRNLVERFRVTFTANSRNDHVTMFILHLPLAVFSFSAHLSSFALGLRVRNILHYSQLCAIFLRKRQSHVCHKHDSKRTFDLKSFIGGENLHSSLRMFGRANSFPRAMLKENCSRTNIHSNEVCYV